MLPSVRVRLSAMMFLQYFALGALLPILAHYLRNVLQFEPAQVGWVMAMPAVAAFVAPPLAAQIADRFVRAERLLAFCHLLSGAILLLLFYQTTFPAVLATYLVYALLFTPTAALGNTIVFHHATDAKREYGMVRVWGTMGWVAVAWTFGYWWLRQGGGETTSSRLPQMLIVSAATSLVLGVYTLTLPRIRFDTGTPRHFAPLASLRVLMGPGLRALCAITFFTALLNQYYYQWMSPFLSQLGFRDASIMPVMSIGQMVEVAAMAMLGASIARLGMKRVLLIGMAMQVFRYFAFALGAPAAVVVVGISVHGFTFAFYFAAAFIYIDTHCTPERRAGVQLLFGMIMAGFGNLAGNVCAGQTAQMLADAASGDVDYRMFWIVPGTMAAAVWVAIAVFFRETSPIADDVVSPGPTP